MLLPVFYPKQYSGISNNEEFPGARVVGSKILPEFLKNLKESKKNAQG